MGDYPSCPELFNQFLVADDPRLVMCKVLQDRHCFGLQLNASVAGP
jgi:hypothetical protein